MGLSYRTNDAFIVMAGYLYKNKINIAYSYDFTTSGIRKYSDGSHEIVLEYKFYKKVKEEKAKVKAIKYSILHMKAVKALQEAMERIETLEAKVKALEDA